MSLYIFLWTISAGAQLLFDIKRFINDNNDENHQRSFARPRQVRILVSLVFSRLRFKCPHGCGSRHQKSPAPYGSGKSSGPAEWWWGRKWEQPGRAGTGLIRWVENGNSLLWAGIVQVGAGCNIHVNSEMFCTDEFSRGENRLTTFQTISC